ncbi:hypothetical protein ED236_03345 [Pseudomethylobacillus aquaticus]|uniref:Peptidase n=1 Tax=Pseudomethylobacillus aquaticus TaxID=2676064 RepID=A0A3N0V6S4_9PROT|nr:PepSY-associated TM helix domain-containing protein [Pseudomethylobacillus aquaticus]ROH88497.1 hypothetical protein ED236_03345 [Pseudomethylobacillus aquaticus]
MSIDASPSTSTPTPRPSTAPARRSFWLRQLYQWHWISSALCLVGMLLFAVTGITLNNAAHIESEAAVVERSATLPAALIKLVETQPAQSKTLPLPVSEWIKANLQIQTRGRAAEWSEQEIYVSMPEAGADAWLSIDRRTGELIYEHSDRGLIAFLNDLHKGRHTGTVWSWFIDIFSVAAILFSLTGMLLLCMRASDRPSTWPLVGLGFVMPLLLLVIFVH